MTEQRAGDVLENRRSVVSCVQAALQHECEAMVLYALGAGVHLPQNLLNSFGQPLEPDTHALGSKPGGASGLEELSQTHAALSDLIAPATPRAITLMHEEKAKHPRLVAFGPVPIVRQLLLVATVSLLSMLLVALSPHINPDSMQHDLLEGEGMDLFICEMFLVSASAVGSSFAALFKLNRYITQGTYDPRYSSTYWIQLALGIIAGVVLSQIIFHTMEGSSGLAAHRAFDQPILALIGGFSAALVYRILNRVLTAIESLFGTDPQAADAFADLQDRRLNQTASLRMSAAETPAFTLQSRTADAENARSAQTVEEPRPVLPTPTDSSSPAALPRKLAVPPPLFRPLRKSPLPTSSASNGYSAPNALSGVRLPSAPGPMEDGPVFASDPE